jgi:hypothetical protein
MSIVGLISTQSCSAEWYSVNRFKALAEKSMFLQNKFDCLYEQAMASFCGSSPYLIDPKIVGFQGYKPRPLKRRKIMNVELDTIRETLLSFPPATLKKEAIENLQHRVDLLNKVR